MHEGDGLKERVASRLVRIEAAAGAAMRGTGVLATIGSTAPFVGLFGTVWGIMNSFIGISRGADDQPRRRRARHRRGAARDRHRPRRRHSGGHHLQHLRPFHHRLPADSLADASAGVERLVSRDLDRGSRPHRARRPSRSLAAE
jgi:biopolymer transport protein ExbB